MKTKSKAGADGAWIPSALPAGGRLGYEGAADEAAAAAGRFAENGDAMCFPERAHGILGRGADEMPSPETDPEADQDSGDLPGGVNEDALDRDELDTDRVTRTEALAASLRLAAMRHGAERRHDHE